jgi:hypothetical protein
MANQKHQIGEGRRLTAACLNIIAAGIVSAGTVPLLAAIERLDARDWDRGSRLGPRRFLHAKRLHVREWRKLQSSFLANASTARGA